MLVPVGAQQHFDPLQIRVQLLLDLPRPDHRATQLREIVKPSDPSRIGVWVGDVERRVVEVLDVLPHLLEQPGLVLLDGGWRERGLTTYLGCGDGRRAR